MAIAPRTNNGSVFAVFEIPKEILESLLKEDFLIGEIAAMLFVSKSSIYRRMRRYGLSKLSFSDISDRELDVQVGGLAVPCFVHSILRNMISLRLCKPIW